MASIRWTAPGYKETVPNARTKMNIGDQLLIFGEKSKIDKFLA